MFFFYCFSPQYEIMLQKLRLITSDEAALLKLMVTPDSSLITGRERLIRTRLIRSST